MYQRTNVLALQLHLFCHIHKEWRAEISAAMYLKKSDCSETWEVTHRGDFNFLVNVIK